MEANFHLIEHRKGCLQRVGLEAEGLDRRGREHPVLRRILPP